MNTVASTGRIALLTLAVLVAVSATVACTSAAPEPNTSAPIVVAAGDIADCYSAGDEATARLLGNIEGTVLTLGDNAYEDGPPRSSPTATPHPGVVTRTARSPPQATTNTTAGAPKGTSTTSGKPPAIRTRATTPTI